MFVLSSVQKQLTTKGWQAVAAANQTYSVSPLFHQFALRKFASTSSSRTLPLIAHILFTCWKLSSSRCRQWETQSLRVSFSPSSKVSAPKSRRLFLTLIENNHQLTFALFVCRRGRFREGRRNRSSDWNWQSNRRYLIKAHRHYKAILRCRGRQRRCWSAAHGNWHWWPSIRRRNNSLEGGHPCTRGKSLPTKGGILFFVNLFNYYLSCLLGPNPC